MDLPIPTHLQLFFTPIGDKNTEYEVNGTIHCTCGNERFEVWESNGRQIVKLVCKQCSKEITILDSGKHGWDGFVCKADYCDRTLPYQKYECMKCGCDAFYVNVFISSQGKQDFFEECVSHDDSFSINDWVDGFEWIAISISCENCSCKEENWVSLETM